MSMDDELRLVDRFEQRHGNESAMARASEFLIEYLSLIDLPPIAKRGLDVATRYQRGNAGLPELIAERDKLATALKGNFASTQRGHPEYGLVQAVHAVLWHLHDPTHGGGASEVISNTFEATRSGAPDHAIVQTLLKRSFPADNDSSLT